MAYKRIVVPEFGGPEVLSVVEDDERPPRPNELGIRVEAAGVSYADMLMREGVHPEAIRPPFAPGWDVVGTVETIGSDVREFEPGERVAALPIRGGYTEYLTWPAADCMRVPMGLDAAKVACLPLNYVTAYQMMHRSVRAKPGERALIHAAAGGIGTALLQLGRDLGLEMYGTARSKWHDQVRALGATPIDYTQRDFVETVRELAPGGVDIVFDGIGGDHAWRSYKALRRGGRVVGYGFTSSLSVGGLKVGGRGRLRGIGAYALAIARSYLIPDGRRITGYSIQTLKRLRPAFFREDLEALLKMLAEDRIDPIVADILPLDQAAETHRRLAQTVFGKLVLRCN